jgi:hypothetical protein
VNNIAPINKGIQVLEKGTNFLSGIFLRWLQSVESRLNRAVVTDDNGNIAYGGATIPDDAHPDYFHIFYPNGSCRVIDFNGTIFDTSNAYVRNDIGTTRWQYIGSGKAGLFIPTSNSDQVTFKYDAIDNGGKLPSGSSINWVQVFQVSTSGNVNIKTGSTYTATL